MKRSIFKSQLWKFKTMGLTAVSLIEDTMIDGVIMTKVCMIGRVKRRERTGLHLPQELTQSPLQIISNI